MDDDFSIVTNAALRHWSSIPRIFTSGYFQGQDYYRPLVNISYMAEYQAFGLSPAFYYLDNIFIHILNAWLIFMIAHRLLPNRDQAFWVAFLFAVHPLHWEAVGNISGRAVLMAGLFSFAAFLCLLRYCQESKARWLVGMVVCYGLGLLSKESAGVFLAVAITYVLMFHRRLWPVCLWLVGVAMMYMLWRQYLGMMPVVAGHAMQGVLLGFCSFLGGLLTYLRLIVMPTGLYFDRSVPLLTAGSWGAVWLPAGYMMAAMLFWRMRQYFPLTIIFCVVWVCLELLPAAQIFVSIGVQEGAISLADHFMYTALAPALVILVAGAYKAVDLCEVRGIVGKNVFVMCAVGAVAFLMITTVQQSFYASNEAAMLKQSLSMNPSNARVQHALGMLYVRQDNFEAAEPYFRRAMALDPRQARYGIALGKCVSDQARYDEAMAVYEGVHAWAGLDALLKQNMSATRQLQQQLTDRP